MGFLISLLVIEAAVIIAALSLVSVWYISVRGLPPNLFQTTKIRRQIYNDAIYFVPLRLFIGLGWLRAFSEKVVEPGWRDGSALSEFLSGQVAEGKVSFPAYERLVTAVFEPQAMLLGIIIMVAQLLVGMAILTGTFTNAALLGGIFMNVNFLLIGEPNPSVFYIVIQTMLFVTCAGAVFGVDEWLSRYIRLPWLVAQPASRSAGSVVSPGTLLGASFASTTIGLYAMLHISDLSPAGSVEDPAMILTILALMATTWLVIAYVRYQVARRSGPLPIGQVAPPTRWRSPDQYRTR